jgi:hypothetical protein
MSYLIEAKNELDGLRKLLQIIIKKGTITGNYLEVLNCLLSVQYDRDGLNLFRSFHKEFINLTGEVGKRGWDKATRVYTKSEDLRSKPSYIKRLTQYPDKPRKCINGSDCINQIEMITNDLANKPGFNTLSFVFLRPADLVDKFRPGYVPCPIAGDFKFRDGRLNLNVMFRTSDALSVGYADIYYLREIQELVLEKARGKSHTGRIAKASIGKLDMFFSRTYIARKYTTIDKKTEARSHIDVIQLATTLIEELGKVI